MSISKDKLIFDPAALAESDDVGAFLRSSDGTLLTHTVVGGKNALDVNIANTLTVSGTVELGATTLAALESITVQNGAGAAAVNIQDGGNSITVDAVALDVRALAFATDKVDASGSTVGVNAISSGGNALTINADGSLNVNADISVANGHEKAEDVAHVSGDIGSYILSVREDVLATSTSASGDYQSVKTDALGRTYTNKAAQTAAFSAVVVDAVTVGGVDLVPVDLANRTRIIIQNVSSKAIFIGNTGVTTATGIRLSAGSSAEFEVGPTVNLFATTTSGTADVRIMEVA